MGRAATTTEAEREHEKGGRAGRSSASTNGNGNGTGTAEHHQSLSAYIQAHFDECSRSQKDVAQYIVDHLDEAAFQTAEELARRANTSSSTVVRFSQALGFEGFPELQARRARGVPAASTRAPASGVARAPPLFSLDQNEFETSLAADHLNVEETRAQGLAHAVEALIEAIVERREGASSPAPTRWRSSRATCATC